MMELQLELAPRDERPLDCSAIIRAITLNSARPRYTFMVLDLIVRAAGANGSAGPYIRIGENVMPIREWLAATIAPSASRRHLRKAITQDVRQSMEARGLLPADADSADEAVESAVVSRVRASGMTAISRAVSELVKAGLIKRHYQGYRVDHHNRGAQRLAVYTVPPRVRAALDRAIAA